MNSAVSAYFVLFLSICFLSSCATKRTPEETIATALTYTELKWMPEERHIRHGKDLKGVYVHTPDTTLTQHGDLRGWWTPGILAKGMAYKWGGFDTPESFLYGLQKGKKAGDIANSEKILFDNAAVSQGSVGIDCSGLVSRCWGLKKHHSTRDFPGICVPITWQELRAGDILLKKGHVILFFTWQDDHMIGFEAGSMPTWKTHRCALSFADLKRKGYLPWRYRWMSPPKEIPREEFYRIRDRNEPLHEEAN